jgi:hypothetical protein
MLHIGFLLLNTILFYSSDKNRTSSCILVNLEVYFAGRMYVHLYRSYFLHTDQTDHFPKMATCRDLFFCVKCIYSPSEFELKDVSSLFQHFFLWPPRVLGGRPRAKCQVKKSGRKSEKESKALCRLWLIVPAYRGIALADDQIKIEALLLFVILWYVSVSFFFGTKHFLL